MANNNLSLPTKLVAIFGAGKEIKAHVVEDGHVTFMEEDTQNLWETKLPPDIIFDGVFSGPGRYKLKIENGNLITAEEDNPESQVPSMRAVQFVEFVDEAVGNPDSGKALAVVFRQLLKDNNITEAMVSERIDALLEKFPSPSVGREAMKNHVTAELAADMMSWEAFTIGMKIVGAVQITLAIR
jgi:hypothetical protein